MRPEVERCNVRRWRQGHRVTGEGQKHAIKMKGVNCKAHRLSHGAT